MMPQQSTHPTMIILCYLVILSPQEMLFAALCPVNPTQHAF